jgi:hypothetical protein
MMREATLHFAAIYLPVVSPDRTLRKRVYHAEFASLCVCARSVFVEMQLPRRPRINARLVYPPLIEHAWAEFR